nr:hypothetical protein [Amycolatopsis sp. H20-H5]
MRSGIVWAIFLARRYVRVLGWDYALSANSRNASASPCRCAASNGFRYGLALACPGESSTVNGQAIGK